MPKTQTDLFERVIDINRHACHWRGLGTHYGYNAILGVDLVERCLLLRRRFPPPIRVLDIGCGDGLALSQLGEALARKGADPGDFELWGMGLNRYEEMSIDPDRFIESGLNAYEPDGTRFHLIVSVFTFHYMWHKLEGLEKIYNYLLAPGGFAHIHFPGYLVRWGETPAALNQTEDEGNIAFSAFLEELASAGDIPRLDYHLVPNYSADDDCVLLAEFGVMQFERKRYGTISFHQELRAFALFTEGFKFPRMNRSELTYVASHYAPDYRQYHASVATPAPYRIASIPSRIARRTFQVDVAIHAYPGESVILLCPGACDALGAASTDYLPVAEQIQRAGLGAVVRYNDPYDRGGDYTELLLETFRSVLGFIAESANTFCDTAAPRIQVMAYSSSCGAVAALAADYEAIETLLLVAPSLDVPRDIIEPGLSRFRGGLYVLIGNNDEIVLPQQAFWFYRQAASAAHREYVELPACGHSFKDPHHRTAFLRSPLWAFAGMRPGGFPLPCAEPTACF